MRKVFIMGVLVLLVVSLGCVSQEEVPTKEGILNAIDQIDAYTYEMTEVQELVSGDGSKRTYTLYTLGGIDRKNKVFFSFGEFNASHDSSHEGTRSWGYFDGARFYLKIEKNDGGVVLTNTLSYTLDELYEETGKYLGTNLTKEEYLEMALEIHDILGNKLKAIISNSTVTSVERDGKLYVLTIEGHIEYDESPKVPQQAMEDYEKSLKRGVSSNVTGRIWVDDKMRPVKAEFKKKVRTTFESSGEGYEKVSTSTIVFNYEFALPSWVEELKSEAAEEG
ncbi:hypothetical protein PAP_02620 [Palaeococcus pacificus DY20341]|uniref:Uncharacterized protein n=1 Tax=Palaeococcus pacificus DY20341 TaxID=1343739 RepID=A0A075LSL3_9EURY|nr:hypothetical protein PAP_02620 [Palaeococcus pacificus DY20341]